MGWKISLLACTALGALTVPASPAAAQAVGQPAAEKSTGIEEIVVTARRREEKAQSVPIVIDTFSQQTLQEQDIKEAQDLSHDVPGFTIQSSLRGAGSSVWIRGIPGVVGYFADVPITVPQSGTSISVGGFNGGALFFDLENVQALKGPQGTLFGLNADAGAILFEPKKPTANFEGYAQVTLGDYNRHEIEGVMNVPVVPDKLQIRIGGEYNNADGWEYDEIQKKYINDNNYGLGRFAADLKPIESIENVFTLNYYYYHSNGSDFYLAGVNPTGFAQRFFPGLKADFAAQQALGRFTNLGSNVAGGTLDVYKQLDIADTLTWDVNDDLTIKNIAGYNEFSTLQRNDYDGTPFPIFDIGSGQTQPQYTLALYSDEVQFQGKSLGEKLNWVVGSFLSFNHTVDPAPNYTVVLGGKSGTLSGISGRTQAIYTQGTYDLSDFIEGLSFTAGYRYSWDWRSAWQNSLNAAGKTVIVYSSDAQFHAPGYTFSLDYQLAPKTLVYVNYSKAYSSGGFNLTAPVQFQKFAPEYVSEVETGMKSDWELYGIKARTNLGGFYGWYDNIQVPLAVTYTDAAGIHLVVETQNAATAHLDGIEGEFTIVPIEGLELTGNGIVMQIKYDKYVSNGVDQSYFNFAYVPRQKYSFGAKYHVPIPSDIGDLSIGANYTWQAHVTTVNTDLTPLQTIPSFQTLDANVELDGIAGHPFDLSFFITNITNNVVNMGGTGAYSSLGITTRGIPDPQMYGFRLRYRFGPGLAAF
jgi:iron complex outermembrane receptor protein